MESGMAVSPRDDRLSVSEPDRLACSIRLSASGAPVASCCALMAGNHTLTLGAGQKEMLAGAVSRTFQIRRGPRSPPFDELRAGFLAQNARNGAPGVFLASANGSGQECLLQRTLHTGVA